MKCPYCGAAVSSEVNYCSVCGVPVIKVPQKAANSTQNPSGKKGKSRMVAAAVYIVIIVIILSVPAYITVRTVVNVTTTEAEISVTSATAVADPFHSPMDGNGFVELTVTITNNGESTLALAPFDFSVMTADGTSYAHTALYDDTVPKTLAAGSTATFSITFEVPTDKTPTKLSYLAMFTSDSVETTIESVVPSVVRMAVAVNNVTDLAASEENGTRVVLVNFDMTNGYDEPLELTPSAFSLRTSSGDTFVYSENATAEPMGTLSAGANMSFSVGFEIPALDTPEALIFESGGIDVEAAVR